MLKTVEENVDQLRKDLKNEKEELENLQNRLKVENIMHAELESKKESLADEQKYIVMALKDEIALQNNKISELEMDLKLLYKKHEILKRDWDF